MVAVRAVRGAIQVDRDHPDVILAETKALLQELVRRNAIEPEDIISVFFTMTPDLASDFPAAAARELGLVDVPLMCATEIDVPNAMKRVIRVLAHVHSDRPRSAIEHVYLRGAARLRPDLAPRTSGRQDRTREESRAWSSS
ncbi:MAG TPA: chorismate mutase [Actinophytocola sp.]|uniref:chorismate mutase n=1 Tax=Actinophytocola sp. TaxID=1872138 RepID=UPI002DDD100D|nr:chorismate mutase [Actinophytocola sp.]HEV2781543.1 chorismate mutase [Actinophytocola sp.]